MLSRTLGDKLPYMGKSVLWLGVFARNKLFVVIIERRPFALLLKIDPRSKKGQYSLALFNSNKSLLIFLIHLTFIILATV